jgi:serine/threonine protein kinase
MAMSASRWKTITPSNFPWEREALDFVREHLPDREPFRAWSNFEFISEDGTINEVDLLILTPQGFFLVEIKSHPGVITGNAMTWVWTHEGRARTDDNPIMLANRKAKRLASLLRKQSASRKINVPYLEPIIFSSHPESQSQLKGVAGYRLCLRDEPPIGDRPARRGIIAALVQRDFDGANENARSLINSPIARAISNAMEQAGLRQSNRSRRVGDYVLGDLLYDSSTGTYQDWDATHTALEKSKRRVRIYNVAGSTSEAARLTINRAARREFELLEGINHPGILRVESFTQSDRGPALIFRHDPDALRFDRYLSQFGDRLSVDVRLSLLRQIAEALRYAHEKRIVHRALSPQSILVSEPFSSTPQTQIFNWQIGYRDGTSSTGGESRLTATSHPEQLVEDASIAYMAPEALTDPSSLGEHLDVFSLGALAYLIFSGQPPASTGFELAQKIRDGRGLQISSVIDGAGKELQELIQLSTHPEVINRLESVADFLVLLEAFEDELTQPDKEKDVVENPGEAITGDRLEGGYLVKTRLGKGSSAIALLVERDGKEFVMKVSNGPDHNNLVRAEAEVLKKLRHPNIVEAYEIVRIGGLTAFTMQRAGEKTLAQRLRSEGRLHIDLLERFGADLLETVKYLEDAGVQHRDIKPDNIGTRPFGKNDKLHLVLFDFSLSQTPADNIRAGTTPYLDPFLSLRKPPRWDLAAERFAAAMTLHEMATGTLPRWGDGQSSAEVLECEVTLSPELFDPNLRESMLAFFSKSLRRDYQERFDNAEEMLQAWKLIFEGVDEPVSGSSSGEAVDRSAAIQEADLKTQLVSLGLSTRAANAIDRINVLTVKDLVRVPLRKIYRLPGVGNKTRLEIAGLANDLRRRFPNIAQEAPPIATTEIESEGAEPEVASVDLIARQVAKFGSSKSLERERKIVHAFIGWSVSGEQTAFAWASQAELATERGIQRADIAQILAKATERWRKNASVTALRNTIAELLEANGGAMTAVELCAAVLIARGSGEEEPIRSQLAATVTRVAIETERGAQSPRFIYRRAGRELIVARSADLADYVGHLGRTADSLASLDPIPTPARALETLRAVRPIDKAPALSDSRLVRLSVAASDNAAVSSRMEIYPRGMAASRTIKLAHGALLGVNELTVVEIQKRVEGRYPEADKLPCRPALDALLSDEGLELYWEPAAAEGEGAYVYPETEGVSGVSSSTPHARFATHFGQAGAKTGVEVPPEIADARVFESKLRRADAEGAFLALVTSTHKLADAEKELLRRFDLNYRNLDEILISVMRQQAAAAGIDWRVVLQGDAAVRESQDWRKLNILVSRCIPIIEQQLSESTKTILLTYPGLLARYDRLDLLESLRDRVGIPGGALHGLWVLLPANDRDALPGLDGKPLPVIGSGQWARIPEAWIANAHRSHNGHLNSAVHLGT